MAPTMAAAARRQAAFRRAAPWLAAPSMVALLTFVALQAAANAATVGFLYLVLVLGLATWGGWRVGALASVGATLCFNFFFLPPTGTWTIAEPANWVALVSFLAASTVASRLVATARRQAGEAERRRWEVERLYELCFGLFTSGQRPGAIGEAAARTLHALEARAGSLVLLGDDGEPHVVRAVGGEEIAIDEQALGRVRADRRLLVGPSGDAYVPLDVGGALNGVLVARGSPAPPAVLEPAGRLLGLAVERERLLAEAAHLEAVRESDTLKTALLRAVSHDLRTPLTAMRLEIDSLGARLEGEPQALASVRGLSLAQERLARRIDNLLTLARLEVGVARPHPEAVPPATLFQAAQESLALLLGGRAVEVRVGRDCPDLWVDPSLGLEIVVNLLENAARAAAPELPLELVAAAHPGEPDRVRIEVRDRGPGLPPAVRRRFATRLDAQRGADGQAGDAAAGGLGLEIASSLAASNGGSLALLDRPGGGAVARLDLPAATEPVLEAAGG